ncbi:hypothetical protein [Gimesia aquarii]|uniref:Uncharacterized protein n=1 Tax=Gimesia aquarii TaxID=2527964 RepID=A0A517WWJ7_9PLAN|nr:hypothetical protein [Gimesia aquarii]QDU09614.1 hypothetical protein V202x_29900 [Gimesia aquarii]
MSDTKLSRQQLYEQIWSTPASRLATEFGLSDVGLAKLCKRHDIPRPPRGYWAKKEVGKAPAQTPLPPGDDNDDQVIVAFVEPEQYEKSGLSEEIQKSETEEEKPEKEIEVAKSLRGAHKLITATKEEFIGAQSDDAGILLPDQDPSLNISVTRNSLHRAFLVMDALIKALEVRDLIISEGPSVSIFGESVAFGIKERIKVTKELPEEHDLTGAYQFAYNNYVTHEIATGELTVYIDEPNSYRISGYRKQWRDAKKQRIEDCLNKVVSGLVKFAARKREVRLEDEEREREYKRAAEQRALEKQQRAELRQQQAEEQERVNSLVQEARSWKTSREIRQYLDFIRGSNKSSSGAITLSPELEQWLSWAEDQADRLDPLKESPSSILDLDIPEEPRSWF